MLRLRSTHRHCQLNEPCETPETTFFLFFRAVVLALFRKVYLIILRIFLNDFVFLTTNGLSNGYQIDSGELATSCFTLNLL